MKLILEAQNPGDYLSCDEVIDFGHPRLITLAESLSHGSSDEIKTTKRVYEYVRDEIPHSGDINAPTVTCRASEVLEKKHGNCCGKAHLLAALLRYLGIPAGFCYQWLEADDKPEHLALHGLNGVYLNSLQRWIRLDARGNKPGVHAEFSIATEKLAWPVRPELGEVDDPDIYASPKKEVIAALTCNSTRRNRELNWIYKKRNG